MQANPAGTLFLVLFVFTLESFFPEMFQGQMNETRSSLVGFRSRIWSGQCPELPILTESITQQK